MGEGVGADVGTWRLVGVNGADGADGIDGVAEVDRETGVERDVPAGRLVGVISEIGVSVAVVFALVGSGVSGRSVGRELVVAEGVPTPSVLVTLGVPSVGEALGLVIGVLGVDTVGDSVPTGRELELVGVTVGVANGSDVGVTVGRPVGSPVGRPVGKSVGRPLDSVVCDELPGPGRRLLMRVGKGSRRPPPVLVEGSGLEGLSTLLLVALPSSAVLVGPSLLVPVGSSLVVPVGSPLLVPVGSPLPLLVGSCLTVLVGPVVCVELLVGPGRRLLMRLGRGSRRPPSVVVSEGLELDDSSLTVVVGSSLLLLVLSSLAVLEGSPWLLVVSSLTELEDSSWLLVVISSWTELEGCSVLLLVVSSWTELEGSCLVVLVGPSLVLPPPELVEPSVVSELVCLVSVEEDSSVVVNSLLISVGRGSRIPDLGVETG